LDLSKPSHVIILVLFDGLWDASVTKSANANVDHLLSVIGCSLDRAWLEQCRDHNKKLERREIVEAAQQRLRYLNLSDALRLKPHANCVEQRVVESVRVYRALLKHKHGRNQAAGYTEREIRKYGPREALIRTIRRGKKTDGLLTLAEHDRLDCAYEQIAIDFATEMPEDVVVRAKQTLAEVTESVAGNT
jgi:hypothetical protein